MTRDDDDFSGSRIFSRQSIASDLCRCGFGTAAVFTARAPEKASENEDAAVVISVGDGHSVLAVADGLGGHAAGEEASALAVQTLAETLVNVPQGSEHELRSAILDAIERANEQIVAMGVGAATTLAVAEISGNAIRPYHVGDSMVLVIGQRGKLKLQTVEHSPVGFAVRSGMLEEKDAIHHEDRHLVSNIVGDPEMHIEVGPTITLRPRDTVLLSSDGLLDNVHLHEIIEIARKGRLQKAMQDLAALARKRMSEPQEGHPSKPDDLTFILFRLKSFRRSRKRQSAMHAEEAATSAGEGIAPAERASPAEADPGRSEKA